MEDVVRIDYDKLGNLIREIVREELDDARILNPDYINKIKMLEKEKGLNFASIAELDELVENV